MHKKNQHRIFHWRLLNLSDSHKDTEAYKEGYEAGLKEASKAAHKDTNEIAPCEHAVAQAICAYFYPKDVDLYSPAATLISWEKDRWAGSWETSWREKLGDYLIGAGSAMNPWPQSVAKFYDSDVEALSADYLAAVSDLYTVIIFADLARATAQGHQDHDESIGRDKVDAESGTTTQSGRTETDRTKSATRDPSRSTRRRPGDGGRGRPQS